MAKVITVTNQKGGVGKTTTAINLAATVAVASEQPTLVIDFDPQSNATSGLGFDPREPRLSIYEALVNETEPHTAILKTETPFLSLLPASMNLVGAEVELVDAQERERKLTNVVAKLRNDFRFIFIDCPPSLGLLTLNALVAADTVLIPVQCEYFALEGLGQLLNTISMVQNGLNNQLTIEGVLMTMYDGRLKLSNQILAEVRNHFGEKVYATVISRNVRLSEAPSYGKPILMYDASSNGAKNYMEVAREFLSKQHAVLVT